MFTIYQNKIIYKTIMKSLVTSYFINPKENYVSVLIHQDKFDTFVKKIVNIFFLINSFGFSFFSKVS